MFDQKMVVRFSDGRTMSCFGDSFLPVESEIMVKDLNGSVHTISLNSLKMVCFIRDFVTDSRNTHRKSGKVIYQAVPGNRIRIVFRDGEAVEGVASLHEKPLRSFFMTPLNPNSNNIHIYVNVGEIESFTFLAQATGVPDEP